MRIQDVDSYIHRSGRTGRAGRAGISVVLYQPSETDGLSTVERVAVSCAVASCIFLILYTVNQKMCHFVFNYNCCVSWSVFAIFTIGNRNQHSTSICNLFTYWIDDVVTVTY